VVAGSFKRAEPHLPEEVLLMRALRDFNTPKLPTVDEGPFFGLLGDLFPGVDPPRKQDASLEDAVVAACGRAGLDADLAFRLKVVQLEELLAIRHCVFVMGPPGSGKTTCWRTLAAARGELRRRTKVVDLDPKVQSPEELYGACVVVVEGSFGGRARGAGRTEGVGMGAVARPDTAPPYRTHAPSPPAYRAAGYIHPSTREWRDGLLSRLMRDLSNEPGDDAKWIVLDGDLGAYYRCRSSRRWWGRPRLA
jgi:dynein heavy chain, axonemal